MIVTITMNPSVDISYPLEHFQLDTVNRVSKVRKTAGGKGLNVTRVLEQLGADVLASGLLGGELGDAIQHELTSAGIKHAFSPIGGKTRNCIAILHEGKQTEILEQGPVISASEAEDFLVHFEQLAEDATILSFSGSLPAGLPVDFYSEMLAICQQKKKPVVLDCSGKALQAVLESQEKPTVIKPNLEELSELLAFEVTNELPVLKEALRNERFAGIEWIVVSLGAQGAFAKHGNTFYQVNIPKIDVVNPVGSGDATVAGITYALEQGKSAEELLKIANVLGMLNAQEAVTGQVNLMNFPHLYNQIKVAKV